MQNTGFRGLTLSLSRLSEELSPYPSVANSPPEIVARGLRRILNDLSQHMEHATGDRLKELEAQYNRVMDYLREPPPADAIAPKPSLGQAPPKVGFNQQHRDGYRFHSQHQQKGSRK